MTQRTFSFALDGGLDVTSDPATLKPGFVISAKNYEPDDEGGYRRMAGYERFDGRPSPSEASYWIVNFDAGTGTAIVPTDIVTGGTSGVTSEVLSVTLESGTWGVDAAGFLVVFNATGLYQNNENLNVSTTRALANGASLERGSLLEADDETNLRAAREARRADIAAVPGEGPVRGVWLYNGITYAFRNAVGGATGVMHASSGAGWTTVALGDYIDFTTGAVTRFLEGEVVTQAVSGATGVVVAVGVTSGSFTGGNAAGRLYLKSVTGTFDATNTLSAPSTGTATSASVLTAVTLPPGGKYEFRNYNFGGSTATYSLWGVNGVGRGFRYDGTDFAFIHVTGLTDALDKPEHLHAHKKQLFFSFLASLQHSGIGDPMVWNAVFGASELATGDVITGLRDQPGDILGVFNRNRTYLLYGDDVNNWDLVNFSLERGAIEWTMQDLGWTFYADDRGVHRLSQTDAYGDLKMAAVSNRVDPVFQRQKLLLIDSVRIKSKNQFRLFYSDNSGLLMRWDNDPDTRQKGPRHKFMPFEYAHKVESICAEEDTNGFERVFFGSDDGFVYEAEKGESFDGALIGYFLRLAFCHCQVARRKKRFHKATIQVDGSDQPPMTFSPEFSYGAVDQPPPSVFGFPAGTFNVGGGIWDTDFWGEFIWDGQLVGEAQAYIDGQGINCSLLVQGESNFERQHTLQSLTYNYSMRGLKR
jgi:hypothetical protein